jgi:hypothetical protein
MLMTTDVQQLLLKIDASTELARRELQKMDTDFARFEKRSEEAAGAADKAFKGLGQAATLAKATVVGFAASIGVEGIVAFGRTILQTADDLEAAAQKAGLGVEKYQTLKESLRSLEVDGVKVDAIFGRLTDTLGAVQGGTAAEGVVNALDRMGIRSRILNGEIDSTDELLDAIAGSAGKFSSEAEFTASVIDIVGRKLGVDLANALKDGGVALKQGEADFRSAGGVVQEEYIARLADANEAIDRFVSNSKSQMVIWAGGTLGALQQVGDYLAGLTSLWDAAAPGIAGAPERIRALFTDPSEVTARGSTNRFISGLQMGGLGILSNGAPQLGAGSGRPGAAAGRGGARGGRSGGGGKRELSPAEQRLNNDVSPTAGTLAALLDPGPLESALGTLQEIKTITVDLEGAEIINTQAIEAANRFGENLSRNLANAIVLGQNLGDALINSFQAAAAEALASGLFDLLTGFLGGGGGGFLSSIFGGFRAAGGPVSAGKAYVVGERGPEIMVPGSSGVVIPNSKLGGGGGVTVNVDARGATDPGAVRNAARLAVLEAAPALNAAISGNTINRIRRPQLPGGGRA